MANPSPEYDFEPRLLAIGKVIENFKLMELLVHKVLCGFISADVTVARIALGGTNSHSSLTKLKSFADAMPLDQETREALLEWIKLAHIARKARNEIAHTVWGFDEEGQEFEVTLTGLEAPAERTTAEAANAASAVLNRVAQTAVGLIGMLALEDCWFGDSVEVIDATQ